MKRKIFSVLFALVLVLSFSLVTAAPVMAAKGSSLGAVKLELHKRTGVEGWGDEGLGPLVGWAIANTNAEGELVVETHLDNNAPNEAFNVFIKVNGIWLWLDVVQSTTNRQGKGNAHAQLIITDYTSATDTINVQVIVRKVGADLSLKAGYATATKSVPLKK